MYRQGTFYIIQEKNMNNKKSKYLIGSFLCGALTALGILSIAISVLKCMSNNQWNLKWYIGYLINISLLLLILYYAFVGYKKPHGNLLKYVILIRVIPFFLGVYINFQAGNTYATIAAVLLTLEIALLCYIAGRLAKAKENLILMIIATICLVIIQVLQILSGGEFFVTVADIVPLITWLDICVAYFLRYKEHREAGLIDTPKAGQ